MAECILNPASQDVADFIYRFGSLQNNLRDPEQFPCVDYVSNDYAVFYTELENALPLSLERQPYYSIPSLFTLLDDSAMEAAGIVSALQTTEQYGKRGDHRYCRYRDRLYKSCFS